MTFNIIIGFLSSISLVFIGIMLKFSTNESLLSYRKHWIWFIIMGSLLFVFKLYKY